MSVHLVLGGARSGKSAYAQQYAADTALGVTVIATGEARDAEMAARIARHRADRPAHWRTREEPLHLATVLREEAGEDRCVLVDCLTLWLLNALSGGEAVYREERRQWLALLPQLPGRIVLVANEVGLGVVPMGELSRRFVDEAGWLNQDVARLAQRVTFVAAGLPLCLKRDQT